jgi:hypothetical protein
MVSLVTVTSLETSWYFSVTKIEIALRVPSITLRCRAGSTSLSGIGEAVAPSRAIASRSSGVALTRIFLPLKSAKVRIGSLAR